MKAKCRLCDGEFEQEDGRTKTCEDCRNRLRLTYRKKWYARTREARKKKAHEWRDRNRARIREYDRVYHGKRRQREALKRALEGEKE